MVNGVDSRTATARLVRPFLRRGSYWTFTHAGMSDISQRPHSMGKDGWASFSDAWLDPRYTAIELCFFLEFYDESWCLRAPWICGAIEEWLNGFHHLRFSYTLYLHFSTWPGERACCTASTRHHHGVIWHGYGA